jgi:hypothetical protein
MWEKKRKIGLQMFEVNHCHRTAPLMTRWLLVSLRISREGKSEASSKSSQMSRFHSADELSEAEQ